MAEVRGRPGGHVLVDWNSEDDAGGADLIDLSWRETGGPSVPAAHKDAFGTAVLQFAIERAMRGTITVERKPSGISYRLSIPRRRAEPKAQSEEHEDVSSAR